MCRVAFVVWCFLSTRLVLSAAEAPAKTSPEIFGAMLNRIAGIIEPATNAPAQTLTTSVKLIKADNWHRELVGHTIDLAFQAPDKLQLGTDVAGRTYRFGRCGQELWIDAPAAHFALVGRPGLARFASEPEERDAPRLSPFKLPLSREMLALLPMMLKIDRQPPETVANEPCQVLFITPMPQAAELLKLPPDRIELWIRERDFLPVRIGYSNDQGVHVWLELEGLKLSDPWPLAKWALNPAPGERVQTAALSYITRFLETALGRLNQYVPPLGPVTGERRIMATEGKGRLEMIDGTKVLFLRGSPEEMGRQQGTLMRDQVRMVTDSLLYGVGVGSSFVKGKWFMGEIESAEHRALPFVQSRYLREMDALAQAAGIDREEARLANFFPELFHCSGFAVFGKATIGGRMYHGRILDYMRGIGLEQNAVVMVFQPDQGNAWVNVGYAGFIGSVTAMNEKQVAIGEMGGRGEGDWDGKPMAQLVREVMEKADTLDEAIDIMRKGPRTCEYYYVISDAKSKRAVGIAATPTRFETIWPGQSHPLLPHPIKDAVLMSAGDRYEALVQRVKSEYGKLDAQRAIELMTPPVCMKSNLHSVLFAPDTLDFWVANADSQNVASETRYTHYNLKELLRPLNDSQAASR